LELLDEILVLYIGGYCLRSSERKRQVKPLAPAVRLGLEDFIQRPLLIGIQTKGEKAALIALTAASFGVE